jgi:hypothetical protein
MLTLEMKIHIVQLGHPNWDYQFSVPPVHTTMWDTLNWIKWIDKNGRWIKKRVAT